MGLGWAWAADVEAQEQWELYDGGISREATKSEGKIEFETASRYQESCECRADFDNHNLLYCVLSGFIEVRLVGLEIVVDVVGTTG